MKKNLLLSMCKSFTTSLIIITCSIAPARMQGAGLQNRNFKKPQKAKSVKRQRTLEESIASRKKQVNRSKTPKQTQESKSLRKQSDNFAALSFPGYTKDFSEKLFCEITGKTTSKRANFSALMAQENCRSERELQLSKVDLEMHPFRFNKENSYPLNLFTASNFYREFLQKFPEIKIVCAIRDLRDLVVEFVFLYTDQIDEYLGHNADIDEKLMWVISNGFSQKLPTYLSIREQAAEAVHWIRAQDILFLRMEDFIDSNANPKEPLMQLRDYLNIHVSSREFERYKGIYADKTCFQSEKSMIGSWKIYFNEEHITEFKKRLGLYLIALGYEADDTW